LKNLNKCDIPIVFISNLREGNKEVVELLPDINKIDLKIGKFCKDIFEKMGK
jgi:hypothetical protein